MPSLPTPPPSETIRMQCAQALAEDLGPDGNDPSAALIPKNKILQAEVICREAAIICGRPWFDEVMHQLDNTIRIDWRVKEGEQVKANNLLCCLHGSARHLLSAERTALNFLQTLSATASQTHRYVQAIADSGAQLLDTRKTLPGLRLAQKYAVRCGGGNNHRIGLFDMIMLKENHILASGSITQAVARAKKQSPGMAIEIEVETLTELEEALEAGISRILLDNMDLENLRKAVKLAAGRTPLEASGGVELETIRQIALTGVDYISTGAITKHVQAIDLSMRFRQP
ncbi:Quinolinate phosphoribosyltransferase [decarboxylating] [hydrothermal vent metagenome]|uniref:Probable nicotinate-nucleotide pyrophosphorylase [carboxylating] n=1 Tax=hydrothermal vent metagenome TaxID=652676 RepID=A0A3B1BL51_9ZZZZ